MTMVSSARDGRRHRRRPAWPDVATVPHSPVRAAVARRTLPARRDQRCRCASASRTASATAAGGPHDPELRLVRPDAFFHRLGATGTIGFGEAYMAGDWTADDLAGVLAAFAAHMRELVPAAFAPAAARGAAAAARSATTTPSTARGENIHRHYDLSNDLFKTFLDESMTYSSALFDGEPYGAADDLADAQRRKVDRLLDAAAVGAGTRRARDRHRLGRARHPRRPPRRARHARSRSRPSRPSWPASASPPPASATASRCCCRTTARPTASTTPCVSVEMIEAVGANHWDEYFAHDRPRAASPAAGSGCRRSCRTTTTCCAPATPTPGSASTSSPAASSPRSRRSSGCSPAPPRCAISDRYAFGRHYAETLRRWRARFEARRRAGRPARLRRDVPPHVVAVPRLLRGGLPHRLPRRRADHADQAAPEPTRLIAAGGTATAEA